VTDKVSPRTLDSLSWAAVRRSVEIGRKALRVAAAQTPEFRDAVESSFAYILDVTREGMAQAVELICFPEAFLQGYLTNPDAARRVALDVDSPAFRALLQRLPAEAPTIVLGMIEKHHDALFNSAVVIHHRDIIGRYRKRHLLPGEHAFESGSEVHVFPVNGARFGINICSDTNFPSAARDVAELGASLIVCPANNMMTRDRSERFKDLHNAVRAERCRETGLWLLSADVTGEREGNISWGPTALLNPRGEVVDQLPLGRPGLLVADILL
jgi:predicted amidohydrolase